MPCWLNIDMSMSLISSNAESMDARSRKLICSCLISITLVSLTLVSDMNKYFHFGQKSSKFQIAKAEFLTAIHRPTFTNLSPMYKQFL